MLKEKNKDQIFVFVDTEFSSFESMDLLSLGAVTLHDNNSFYEEVDYKLLIDDCSGFVLQHVIPLLDGPRKSLPSDQVWRRWQSWLTSLKSSELQEIVLISDAPSYDGYCIRKWASNQKNHLDSDLYPRIVHLGTTEEVILQCFEDVLGRDYREHHAMDDVLLNKYAYFNAGGYLSESLKVSTQPGSE